MHACTYSYIVITLLYLYINAQKLEGKEGEEDRDCDEGCAKRDMERQDEEW